MSEGEPRVTSIDVANAAGVSQSTVSRVLQADPRVRPETRERVLDACARLSYSPNALARAMRNGGTGVIGLVVADIRNPFFSEAIEAFSLAASAADRSAVIWNADSDAEALKATQERLIDGLIFTTALPDSAMLKAAMKMRIPMVLFNRGLPELDCDQVVSSNYESGRAAAAYSVSHGRVDLAVVHGASDISTTEDRARGCIEEAARSGASCRSIRAGIGRNEGYDAAQRILSDGNLPETVFCTTDICAAGFIDGVRASGVRVPEDLWVIGFDGIPLAQWQPYQLTTFEQPLAEMVSRSMDLLIRRINNPSAKPSKVVVENTFAIRHSTADAEWRDFAQK